MNDSSNNDKPLKPVKRRNLDSFGFMRTCSFYGAAKKSIYGNNTGKGQFQCKACKHTFTVKTSLSDQTVLYCLYCNTKLDLKHDRKEYLVFAYINKNSPHYYANKKLLQKGDAEHLKTSSGQYLPHYHYR